MNEGLYFLYFACYIIYFICVRGRPGRERDRRWRVFLEDMKNYNKELMAAILEKIKVDNHNDT